MRGLELLGRLSPLPQGRHDPGCAQTMLTPRSIPCASWQMMSTEQGWDKTTRPAAHPRRERHLKGSTSVVYHVTRSASCSQTAKRSPSLHSFIHSSVAPPSSFPLHPSLVKSGISLGRSPHNEHPSSFISHPHTMFRLSAQSTRQAVQRLALQVPEMSSRYQITPSWTSQCLTESESAPLTMKHPFTATHRSATSPPALLPLPPTW